MQTAIIKLQYCILEIQNRIKDVFSVLNYQVSLT